MKRTILIAEDVQINRKILKKILSEEFEVLEAANGWEALENIQEFAAQLAAVILDINMPLLSGFDILKKMRENEAYQNIPVIIATGNNDRENELRALKLGAWDFVAKPYDVEILKFRLHNVIERSKLNLFEQLKQQAEKDSLTGLYNETKFCQAARQLIDSCPEQKFAVIRFDIDRFKQFNSFFGVKEGNRFLQYIAKLLRDLPQKAAYRNCVYARLEADVFAVCAEYTDFHTILHSIDIARKKISAYSANYDIVTVYGIYQVTERKITVRQMLDRATLAARTRKGNYMDTVAIYTDEMGSALQQEQDIVNIMNAALEDEQFVVYYQPKYNIAENRPCGAEALVRWKHPDKGMISPGVFIPIFEKNGFIAKVDYFVWKKTCENLKKWQDAGWNPQPVSVNISRVNLSNPNIVEMITDLVKHYEISPDLLQLEITESAYMDNPEIMHHIVHDFHKNGFTILMDDFGSGYSSLNTLKDISVDILKIDMKFLPTGDNNTKSEKILASIIRMADWIGMPVICEGVETEEQRDFLQSVGCLFVQGYLYGRPMPVAEYETLVAATGKQQTAADRRQEKGAELDDLLSADSSIETLLRSIGVPVVIYAYESGNYDRIRANQCFFDMFGYENISNHKITHISANESEQVDRAFQQVVQKQGTMECESLFIMPNGAAKWFRLHLRYVMPAKSGHIICAVYTEITEAKRVEQELNRVVSILNRSTMSKQIMLIVDDSSVSRAVLRNIFQREFQILEAANGAEALRLLSVHVDEIAIILLDMLMPVMNGAEFLTKKAAMESAMRIPVVVISSESDEALQVNMLSYGVNDYITKPFVSAIVHQRVHNVLEYQSRFEELVNEYRQALSMSPTISGELVNTCFTVEQMRTMIAFLMPIFDVVRVVDPKDTAIITLHVDGTIEKQPYTCFRVWNKEERCENCTSEKAVQGQCQMNKYEFMENNIFYVVSRPIEIVLPDDTKMRIVLEIVSHVSDALILQELSNVPIWKILEHTKEQIYCDPLTNAYNRRYLYEMRFLVHHSTDGMYGMAFIMIDLNRFKQINDEYGHAEGDRVLCATVEKLQTQIRITDTMIRYGGDEFLIILSGCSRQDVEHMIERLQTAVGEVTYGRHQEKHAEAAFGYAFTEYFTGKNTQLDALIRQADCNMYVHKNRQKKERKENTSDT